VTKLRARPDVLLPTGYNPDITLFLRQAKEAGHKFQALVGHGAGCAQYDLLGLDDLTSSDVRRGLFPRPEPSASERGPPSRRGLVLSRPAFALWARSPGIGSSRAAQGGMVKALDR
jgi:ABC-type branched-subunit amino acid transport system substrate-binding protein